MSPFTPLWSRAPHPVLPAALVLNVTQGFAPVIGVSPDKRRTSGLVQRRAQPRDQPLPRLAGEVLLDIRQHLGAG